MPVNRVKDSKRPLYRWGGGKKYDYTSGDKSSRTAASRKAGKQGRAARASGYRG